MTTDNGTPQGGSQELAPANNALGEEGEMNKFQGMITQDGAVVKAEPAKPANDKPAGDGKAKGSVPAVPAKKPDDADPDGDDAGDDDEQSQRHKSAQRRINKAVGRQRAAERRATAAEVQLARMEARIAALEGGAPAQQNQQQQGDKEPNPADFEHGELDAGYIRAVAKWEVRQEMKANQNTQRQQQTQAQQQEAQRVFQSSLDTFLTKGLDIAEDFEEVIKDESFHVSQMLAELAFDSEHGTEILYAAGSDPKVAKAVSAMSPVRQAAWFGQREAELSSATSDAGEHGDDGAPPDSSSPKTSKAPEPLKGKARGSGQPQQVGADTPDFAAFEALATKQD